MQIVRTHRGSGRRKLAESEKKKYIPKSKLQPIKIEKRKTRIKNLKKKQKIYIKKKRIETMCYIQEKIKSKRSIIKIYNNDNYCLIRAILIAKSIKDKQKNIIKKLPTISQINKEVKILCKKLELKNHPMGIPETIQIERYLKNYSINLLDANPGVLYKKILYKGPYNRNFIYIVLTKSS